VQSSSQIITTNKPTSNFFTGRMLLPFLSPNGPTNSVKALKGKISHSMDLLTMFAQWPQPPPSMDLVSKSMECDIFPFSALTLLVGPLGDRKGKSIRSVKNWMLVSKSMECDIFPFSALTLLVGPLGR